MALLKAFACQVILLGLYKLFLEQVVEDHLVPDELTRNCLVGFVCLLCFGIQLYTDRTEDEDSAEADENPKSESRRAKNEKKSEPPEIYGIYETVGSNASSRVTATKPQATSQENGTEKKMSPNDKVGCLREERSNAVPSSETVKVTNACHSGIFAKLPPNMPDTIPNVINVDGMREPEVSVSTTRTSFGQETTPIPVLNGFSETNVYEESDEDCIEIDQFVSKESGTKAEQFRTVNTEEIEAIQVEDVSENFKQLIAVDAELEAIKPQNATEQTKQLRTFEDEVEVIKPDDVVSECLTAKENISSMQDSNETTTIDGVSSKAEITNGMIEESLETGVSSKAEIINGTVEESLNNIDSLSSNIIEENGCKTVKDESEIVHELSSEPDEHTEDILEILPSAQEMSSNTSSTSTKVMNGVDTMNKNIEETSTKVMNDVDSMNKNNVETSTLVKDAVLSPSEKLTVSTRRQKLSAAEDVCVAPVTIDISFIYACH